MRRQTPKLTEDLPSSSQLEMKAVISARLTLNNWTEKTKKMSENTQYTTTRNNNKTNTNVVITIIIIVVVVVVVIKLTYTSSITVN